MTIIDTAAIRQNHDQTIQTPSGTFYVEQRNGGFVANDGAWVVTLLPDNVWSTGGVLCQARSGRHVGVYPTTADAEAAIASTPAMPYHPHPEMIR